MRTIRLAAFLAAAALVACEGKRTLSDQSEAVAASGVAGHGAALQSKVAMPAAPAAPAMGAVAGVASAADAASPRVSPQRADYGPDDIQNVSYASTAANTMIIR